MENKGLLVLIAIIYFFGCSNFNKESHIESLKFSKSGLEYINCVEPPWGTYKCKIIVVNSYSCDYKIQMFKGNSPYSSNLLLSDNKKTIYYGDWYGDKMKLHVQKMDSLCFPNESLEVKYIYYH